MKKRFLCLLLSLCLFLAGCSDDFAEAPIEIPEIDYSIEEFSEDNFVPDSSDSDVELLTDVPSLEDYMDKLDMLDNPERQYGENAGYISLEEDFVIRILYPMGENTQLNEAIDTWITDTVDYYYKEYIEAEEDMTDSAELTVDYESYLIKDTFASVKLTGHFNHPHLAHPVNIIATFNADLSTGNIISLSDILSEEGEATLKDMIVNEIQLEEEFVDENFLKLWNLTSDGLQVSLIRGEYLPMSDGSPSFFYPYSEIESLLSSPLLKPEETAQSSDSADEEASESTEEVPEEVTPAVPSESQTPEESTPPASSEPQTAEADTPSEPQTAEAVTPPPQTPADASRPMIALTFDDGPSAHTDRLLDTFTAHGGKGTFFVVGNTLESRADTLRKTASLGHEIAGHSWNHYQLTKLSVGELTDQIMNTRAKIFEITGVDTTLMRPPYGSYNDQVKATCSQLGIVMVNWSVDTLDWKHKNADRVYQKVMEGAKDGAIILLHDLHKTTVDAMERAIPDLLAQGYQLVTVSELLSHSDKEIVAGNVYNSR